MPTAIERYPNGVFYLLSAVGNQRFKRELPGCPSRNDVHDLVRAELTAAGATVGRSVAIELGQWTWNGEGWQRDATHATQPTKVWR